MNGLIKKCFRMLILAIICSFISSISIIPSAFVQESEKISVAKIIFPLFFWIGLGLEQYFFWKSNVLRKKILNACGFQEQKSKCGLISFAQNKYATITDATMIISLLFFLILMIARVGENSAQYIFIFLLVLSFRLHTILNGKNFRYIIHFVKKEGKKDVKND